MTPLITQPTEFFQLDIGGSAAVDAWMIKPKGFDPSHKYPVFVYVYWEPHGIRITLGHDMAFRPGQRAGT